MRVPLFLKAVFLSVVKLDATLELSADFGGQSVAEKRHGEPLGLMVEKRPIAQKVLFIAPRLYDYR